MRLSKLLERFYRKVFIAVAVMRNTTEVLVETRKHGTTVKKSRRTFNTVTLDEEITGYIAAAASQSPLHYIAVLNTFSYQGAIPTCSTLQLPRFADVTSCQTRCFDESWSVYASDESIYQIREFYAATGLDFIFSPFSLLRNYFAATIEDGPALYLLLAETYVVTAVFKEKRLLFGAFGRVSNGYEPERVVDLDREEGASGMQEQVFVQQYGTQPYFMQVMHALKSFYNDDRYEKVFIEKVLIADATNTGERLKTMLSDELLVGVERYEVDLAEEVAALAVAEVEDEG